MSRPTVAQVDLAILKANFRAIAEFATTSPLARPQVIGIVKANAYGHGAAPAALALEEAGATMLACADVEEGVALRDAGVRVPILVFGSLAISDLDGIFTHQLTPTLATPSSARALQAAAAKRNTRVTCHLKIDTGMNRLGFRHDDLGATMPEVASSSHLEIAAVYTHFATADNPEHPAFGDQRVRFEEALGSLPGLGIHVAMRHAANSAAFLRDERVWYDFVRPGLLMYGVVPPPLATTLPVRPVLSLRSRIVEVKRVGAGEAAGYGLKVPFESAAAVAIVPAGYADGLDWRLAGRGCMLVRGKRVPIVGSVCMDVSMIDVTGMDVGPGEEVVIIGDQGDESIGVREMAASIGTIPYELLCRIGSRVQRVYAPAR